MRQQTLAVNQQSTAVCMDTALTSPSTGLASMATSRASLPRAKLHTYRKARCLFELQATQERNSTTNWNLLVTKQRADGQGKVKRSTSAHPGSWLGMHCNATRRWARWAQAGRQAVAAVVVAATLVLPLLLILWLCPLLTDHPPGTLPRVTARPSQGSTKGRFGISQALCPLFK